MTRPFWSWTSVGPHLLPVFWRRSSNAHLSRSRGISLPRLLRTCSHYENFMIFCPVKLILMLCLYKLLFLQIFLYLLYYSTFGKTQNFRKVFAEALDRFGFVLCGTAGTENRLDYDHITLPDLGVDGLCSSNFRLLEFVEKEVKVMDATLI